MAKGGPAISAGPTIASSRGGSPLGVRVGGIEGGRSIQISPAEARITKIFGPAIKSHNIGFGVPNPRGERSVRPFGALKNPIPERGESGSSKPRGVVFLGNSSIPEIGRDPGQPRVVTRTIRFIELVPRVVAKLSEKRKPNPVQFPTVRAVTESVNLPKAQIEPVRVKPEVRSVRGSVERVFVGRLRTNLARLIGTRIQTGPAARAETSRKAQPQPQVGAVLKTFVRENTAIRTKPEIGFRVPNRIRNKSGYADRSENGQAERRRREYVVVDDGTNARRLVSLREALRKLQTTAPGDIRGEDLVKTAEISSKRHRSNLLWQLGLENRIDGSAHQLGEDLSQEQDITFEKLERAINRNNAVEKADNPAGVTATYQETQKVLTPPNSFPERVPAILVTEQVEIVQEQPRVVENPKGASPVASVEPVQISNKLETDDTGIGETLDNIITFPRNLLDKVVDNNIVGIRRQSVLAA